MALTSYKNPPTITSAGAIAQNPTLQVSPAGQVFNPQGAVNNIVPGPNNIAPRPVLQSPANNIVPGPNAPRPIQAPPPQIQFPQQPLRAPAIPRPGIIQQVGDAASDLIGKNPLVQIGKGVSQGQSIGQSVGQAARQSAIGRLGQRISSARGALGRLGGKLGSAAAPAAVSGLATPGGVGALISLVPLAIEAGPIIRDEIVAPEQAAAEQALADSIIRLEQAKADAKQRQLILQDIQKLLEQYPGLQEPPSIPLSPDFPPFVETPPWSPTPIIEPPIELPPIDPGQDIGLDLPPIERPAPPLSPVVPVDPITSPDLTTGKGGVNLNTPIWQKISAIEKRFDDLKIPEPDWSSILAPVLDKLDLILVAIPPLMDGITTAIEAPPNIEIPQPDLTPVLNAIQTGLTVVPPATITAIGTLLVPVVQGLTAISAQIATQKISTSVVLPQSVALAAAIPQSTSLAAAIPQSVALAAAIPQATALAAAIPQATKLAAAIPQALTVTQDNAQTQAQLDLLQQLNIDQITKLTLASEEAIEQGNRIKNLTLEAKKCCNALDKKLRDIEGEQQNIKNNLKTEFDKNEQRFPMVTREGTYKCKEDEPEGNYNFGGHTLQALQGHLDLMLELQKLVVYKLCNFEVGGEITGELDLTCEGDEQPTVLPFAGKGIDGLALQSGVMLEGLKRIWAKVCGDTEITGEIPLLCPPDDTAFPEFTPYQGKGIQGLSAQLSALAQLNQKVLQESCKKNEPIIIKSHYETHLEEFRVTKSLELTFGEEYPSQKGSLWQITVPYPKGEFIGEGELAQYSLWNWEDDFESLERLHGRAYCRLDLAGSNRYMAVFARDTEIGRDWLRMLYEKFVDSEIAPPSSLDDDGLPFVKVSPGKKPKHNPVNRTTKCVRAVVSEFDENNEMIRCAAWYPTRL